MSDRKIQQRKLERFKQLHKEEIQKEKDKRKMSKQKSSSRVNGDYSSRIGKRTSDNRNDEKEVSESKRVRRERVAFPMPKNLPRSVLYEMSQSRPRTSLKDKLKDKSVSSVMGPALPESESKPSAKESREVKRKISLLLSDLDDISSEEDASGLQTNTEIDRLLKEALKVRSTRKRRLVVLELLRRLQLAKEARVRLVAKRKAQAVIIIHAIFERVKVELKRRKVCKTPIEICFFQNLETAVLDRRVEALEQVRMRQLEQEKLLKEEMARKEALKALKKHQKLQSQEGKATRAIYQKINHHDILNEETTRNGPFAEKHFYYHVKL